MNLSRLLIIYTMFLVSNTGFSQGDMQLQVQKFQQDLIAKYYDPQQSPLNEEERNTFKGFDFYPINEKYILKARYEAVEHPRQYSLPTSSGKNRDFIHVANAYFEFEGVAQSLHLLQSVSYIEKQPRHLLLAFKDSTNGVSTYGGGRFIDLEIPEEGEALTINFNMSYQPYCAYTEGYSCLIPPKENILEVAIEAGIIYHKERWNH